MKIIDIKRCLALCLLALYVGSGIDAQAQDKPLLKHATIYLVRHAEKDTGDNPRLNAAGRLRAGYLVAALDGHSPNKVFVTQYRRTQETADSIRFKMKVDTVHYPADASGEGLIKSLHKHHIKNEKILIIGHSNTIPILLGRLGISKPITIGEKEYNIMYLIKYVKGEPILFKKKFGDPLMQTDNSSWEEVL